MKPHFRVTELLYSVHITKSIAKLWEKTWSSQLQVTFLVQWQKIASLKETNCITGSNNKITKLNRWAVFVLSCKKYLHIFRLSFAGSGQDVCTPEQEPVFWIVVHVRICGLILVCVPQVPCFMTPDHCFQDPGWQLAFLQTPDET